MTTSCLATTVDRNLFAGRQMDDVVDVLTTLHYADLNVERNCLLHYYSNSSQYTFCTLFTQSYNTTQFPPTSAAYTAATTQHFLPILILFNSFMPAVGNFTQGNTCFVTAQRLTDGQLQDLVNLPPINNVTIDPALPPINFVSVLYAFHRSISLLSPFIHEYVTRACLYAIGEQ